MSHQVDETNQYSHVDSKGIVWPELLIPAGSTLEGWVQPSVGLKMRDFCGWCYWPLCCHLFSLQSNSCHVDILISVHPSSFQLSLTLKQTLLAHISQDSLVSPWSLSKRPPSVSFCQSLSTFMSCAYLYLSTYLFSIHQCKSTLCLWDKT